MACGETLPPPEVPEDAHETSAHAQAETDLSSTTEGNEEDESGSAPIAKNTLQNMLKDKTPLEGDLLFIVPQGWKLDTTDGRSMFIINKRLNALLSVTTMTEYRNGESIEEIAERLRGMIIRKEGQPTDIKVGHNGTKAIFAYKAPNNYGGYGAVCLYGDDDEIAYGVVTRWPLDCGKPCDDALNLLVDSFVIYYN